MNTKRTALQLVLIVSPVLSLMAAPVWPTDASPAPLSANFTVASTADEPDTDLGDGLCYSTLAGDCTLRAAIQQANALPGDHVIRFGASLPTPATFLLARSGDDDTARDGDLDITGRVSLIGAGAGSTIIDGNRLVTSERVFHVTAGAVVTLTGITVQNGYHPTFGGGVYNQGTLVMSSTLLIGNLSGNGAGIASTGSLTFVGGTLRENAATNRGGALFNEGGTASLTDSTLTANSAINGGGIFGGSNGTVTLTDTDVTLNTASDFGGGIYNTVGATLAMFESSVIANRADDPNRQRGEGGGIYNNGTATLSRGTIYANDATGWGAGIYNFSNGLLTIDHGNVVFNTTAGWAGGIYNAGRATLIRDTTIMSNAARSGGGGGIMNYGGPLTLTGSAVISNTALYNGGGIYNIDPMTVTNSTISGNQAREHGGGIYSLDVLDLSNTTVAGNSADSDDNGTETGGGVASPYGFTMRNSIISGNVHLESGSRVPDDCAGTLTSHGYNLIEFTGGCALSGMTGSDKYGLSALLRPLTDYGGPTLTNALFPGSPAVDAGNPGGCYDAKNVLLVTDQRGEPRPSGLRCDMGAFELESLVPTPTPTATRTPTATSTRTATAPTPTLDPTATGTLATSTVPTLTPTQPPDITSTPTPPTAVATTSTPVGRPTDQATPTADGRHRIYCPVVRKSADGSRGGESSP